MTLEAISLASGSSGNAILVREGPTAILIDAGVGIRKLTAALRYFGTDPSELSAILITHEHADHIKGAVRTARRFGVPLVANAATLEAIDGACKVPVRVLDIGKHICFDGLEVRSFEVSHDAACPVGYTISSVSGSITSVTDTGLLSDEICAEAADADLLILESNYDDEMLSDGPYPHFLKWRIRSQLGHLSNDAAATLIVDLAESGKNPSVWLAHLSQVNNSPAIALASAQHLLWACSDVPMDIAVAQRDIPSLRWVCSNSRRQFSSP
ncbi:MAG: MBL fold metallo-hydrolase [Armatimonadetes bacterium]|nr:MBL fold metallo-hydrolase [Armatimonadota bacterium]